jgi:hypothetical protein
LAGGGGGVVLVHVDLLARGACDSLPLYLEYRGDRRDLQEKKTHFLKLFFDGHRSAPISPDQPRSAPISPDQPRSAPISPDQPRSAPISREQTVNKP